MLFTKLLSVTKDDFFDAMVTSICYDIEASTGKTMKKENLKDGYTYKKNMGKNKTATVVIEKLEQGKTYKATFSNSQGCTTLAYEITEIEEDLIEVSYSEEFESTSKLKQWNYALLSPLYVRKTRKRTMRLLEQMELYINSNTN